MNDLSTMNQRQLRRLHTEIMDAFRRRRAASGAGHLTAKLARFLFCAAYGWREAPAREKGYSAVDAEGLRFLIRGRRLVGYSPSRELSAIADIDEFSTLAAVLLDGDLRVVRAALVPHAVVLEWGSFVRATNRCAFKLSNEVWRDARVVDATGRLRTVESKG